MYMKHLTLLAAFMALFFLSCSKIGPLESNEAGFISVDGVKMISLNYGYEANQKPIGFSKSVWRLFEKKQELGSIDWDQMVVYLTASVNPVTGETYPSSIDVCGVPGCEKIYLDGIKYEEGKGYYHNKLAHYVKPGEEPEWDVTPVTFRWFSYPESCEYLQMDITIEKDGKEIRIVYDGPTPNDGEVWMVN